MEVSRPIPGYYKTRLVKQGPWVPVEITRECHCTPNGGDENAAHEWREDCDRYPPLVAYVNGLEADPTSIWPWVAGREISRAEFDKMHLLHEWAKEVPTAPESNPRSPIDPMRAAPLF